MLAFVVLAGAVAELGLRVAYEWALRSTERFPLVYERVYWAVPPWVQYMSVMYRDPELGLWMKPSSRRTYVNLFGPIGDLDDVGRLFDSLRPELPEWALERAVWRLETNSLGLRNDELGPKEPGTFRIVTLGDSWTVGVNVEREETYPARLAALLQEGQAAGRVEVVNYGVVGGAAETGRRILPRVLALDPDLVVVAFAQNDEAAVRRETKPRPRRATAAPPQRWQARLRGALQELELYKLWTWWRARDDRRVAATLRQQLTRASGVPVNAPGRRCDNPNASSTAYRAALDEVVTSLQQAGVAVLLLYANVPDFASHCTLQAMRAVAAERGVPLLDASQTLETLELEIAAADERRLGLAATPAAADAADAITAVLRVDMSADASGRPPYVMGNDPALGSFVPNAVPLFDDGSHGDQRAGDRVWSRAVTFAQPGVRTYAFTNGGRKGAWTGLENYRLRAWALRDEDRGRTVYLPVAQFGRHALRSDPSHPDAAGYDAIARLVAGSVAASDAFRRRP